MLSLIHPNHWANRTQEGTEELRSILRTPAPEMPAWLRTIARIPREASRLEMLAGMALGAGFFQAGRILGLRALLGLGMRGPVALGLGRAAGLATESAGFIAASHGVAHLAGRPIKTDGPALIQEWLSLGMFLAAMRFSHAGVRQAYGHSWVPKTQWQKFHYGVAHQGAIFAATAGTALAEQNWGWRKYTDTTHLIGESIAMMGTFQLAGLAVNRSLSPHLSPMIQKLEVRARGLEKKTQTAITSPYPNLALAAAVAGGGSSPMGEGNFYSKENAPEGKGSVEARVSAEGNGEEATVTIRTFKAIGPGEIVRHINDPKTNLAQEILKKDFIFQVEGSFQISYLDNVVAALKKKTMLPDGKLRPIPPDRKVIFFFDPILNPSLPLSIEIPFGEDGFSVPKVEPIRPGSQKNGGSEVDDLLAEAERVLTSRKRENPRPAAPETSRSRQESSLLNIGQAHLPIPVENFMEFSRKVKGHPEQIEERLFDHDLSVVFQSGIGFKVEFALNALNGLPNLAKIIGGRSVAFSWPGNTHAAVVFKQGDKFVDGTNRKPIHPTPPSTKRTPILTSEHERAAAPSSDHPFDKDSKTDVWKARHIPSLFDDLTHLPNYMRQTVQEGYPGTHPTLIYEKHTVDLRLLEKITAEMNGLGNGTFWELLVPANILTLDRSFLAVAKDGKLKWSKGSEDSWDNAKHQAPFSKRIVTDAAEIYQHLEALSRVNEGNLREIAFQHRGNLSQGYVDHLGPFLEATLNLYGLKGGKVMVLDQKDRKLLELFPKNSGWRYSAHTVSPLVEGGK